VIKNQGAGHPLFRGAEKVQGSSSARNGNTKNTSCRTAEVSVEVNSGA